MLAARIKELTHAKVSLEDPECVYQVEKLDDGSFVLGVSTHGIKEFTGVTEDRGQGSSSFHPQSTQNLQGCLSTSLALARASTFWTHSAAPVVY